MSKLSLGLAVAGILLGSYFNRKKPAGKLKKGFGGSYWQWAYISLLMGLFIILNIVFHDMRAATLFLDLQICISFYLTNF
ncbi:hypothetical protein D3H65_08630 [Paraflavitalea soli]|uniref:Uncharacterized protein n=1 Tax=Paraflavitalea soli TaxID=2315862 RepID=A0A3B7MI11_9BACT|nr:hypothetical protein [Paraflavitalea soli]AXY74042.1 hypothetical protein D3H65_08630 [Paraflavitalea soli]